MITDEDKKTLTDMADDLENQIDVIRKGPLPTREFSIFVTKMEEAYLWLRRAIEKG